MVTEETARRIANALERLIYLAVRGEKPLLHEALGQARARQDGDCPVCGIGQNYIPTGYVCTRSDCPTRTTSTVATGDSQ